jgi:hypothetical protein
MHRLFLRLSQEIHARQLRESTMSDPKNKIDIWGRLEEFIDQVPAVTQQANPLLQQQPVQQETETFLQAAQFPARPHKNSVQANKRFFDKIQVKVRPHMKEQMHKNALHHINMSYFLAHKGDRHGAKLHIELAENAVHTASRFMSDEEYEAFEQVISLRIERFIDDTLLEPA